jgi:hypothetical protein
VCSTKSVLQVWTAVTGLAIASTLAAALKSEAKAFELSQAQHIEEDDLILTGSLPLPERPLFQTRSGLSEKERDDEALRDLLPFQVGPEKLAETLEKIVSSDGGIHGAAAQTAECAHSNRVHLIVAQVLASAYVVRRLLGRGRALSFFISGALIALEATQAWRTAAPQSSWRPSVTSFIVAVFCAVYDSTTEG